MKRFAPGTGTPPQKICLVRLSAIGDVTHILPVINTIRSYWPQTKITWIIGKREFELVHDLPEIEFITFDKSLNARAYLELYRSLRHRSFDVLLLMQLSLRANLIPPFINAPIKIGFDRKRSRELHGLFINRRIRARENQHVLDAFFGFTEYLGIHEKRLVWDNCYSDEERGAAKNLLSKARRGTRTLLLSPCARHAHRNWLPDRYAAIADYAAKTYAMQIILTGGHSSVEYEYGRQIAAMMSEPPINLIGKTTLRQLAAVIGCVDVVIALDSGTAHLASSAGKPVIGLYAASNPDRTAPYLNRQWCVNRYPDAARRYLGKGVREIPWGTRIKHPDAMKLISVEDVREKLDALERINGTRSSVSC